MRQAQLVGVGGVGVPQGERRILVTMATLLEVELCSDSAVAALPLTFLRTPSRMRSNTAGTVARMVGLSSGASPRVPGITRGAASMRV